MLFSPEKRKSSSQFFNYFWDNLAARAIYQIEAKVISNWEFFLHLKKKLSHEGRISKLREQEEISNQRVV